MELARGMQVTMEELDLVILVGAAVLLGPMVPMEVVVLVGVVAPLEVAALEAQGQSVQALVCSSHFWRLLQRAWCQR